MKPSPKRIAENYQVVCLTAFTLAFQVTRGHTLPAFEENSSACILHRCPRMGLTCHLLKSSDYVSSTQASCILSLGPHVTTPPTSVGFELPLVIWAWVLCRQQRPDGPHGTPDHCKSPFQPVPVPLTLSPKSTLRESGSNNHRQVQGVQRWQAPVL